MSVSELENWATQLTGAVRTYGKHCQTQSSDSKGWTPLIDDNSTEADRARRDIINISSRLQTQLTGPAEFLQQLAYQNQILACLKWLGTFQILACIPLADRISIKEVADISGVSEIQLCRIVRLTATAGFLCEPVPGQVAHTPLSSSLVTNLCYLDAALFLAETAAPSAWHMTDLAQANTVFDASTSSAYGIAFNTSDSFHSACAKSPQLQRRSTAYHRLAGAAPQDKIAELLSNLNWNALGTALIVDVGASSPGTAVSLAKLHPNLRFVAQMAEPTSEPFDDCNGRVIIQKRVRPPAQDIKDAAVYILHLHAASTLPCTEFAAELQSHMKQLQSNPLATLILAPLYLPEPATVDRQIEAAARERDLCHQQLVNERGLELDEVLAVVASMQEGDGRLVVVNRIYSRNDATMALGVKYQPTSESERDAVPGPTIYQEPVR